MCTGRKAGEIDLALYADAVDRSDLSPPPEALVNAGYEISEEYVTYLCPECGNPHPGDMPPDMHRGRRTLEGLRAAETLPLMRKDAPSVG